MKYAKIDSQGYMIYEDTNKTQKNKLFPKHFAVRRLSNVRVLPEGVAVDTKRIDEMNKKNEFQDKLNSDQASVAVEKKVINLDDQEFKLIQMPDSQEEQNSDESTLENNNDKTKNAKTPLPKPKNPPKLPE